MRQLVDNILATIFVATFIFIVPVTYAIVNVATRPDTITVALELPQPKPVMIVYDVINPEPGKLLDPPSDFPIYWEWKASGIADYTTYIEIRDNQPEALEYFAQYNDPSIHTNERAYTPEEHLCLAENVYFEAGVEGVEGRLAVALVTLERVQDPRYPNNICDVVWQQRPHPVSGNIVAQFSWTWDGKPDRPENMKSYQEIVHLVNAILDPDASFYDPTYDSTHYHADYVNPYWATDDRMFWKATIETHIFYREEPDTVASL